MTTEHLFTQTGRKTSSGLVVWRCEKCDSEVAFRETMNQRDVHQAVEIKWPKFVCISFHKKTQ